MRAVVVIVVVYEARVHHAVVVVVGRPREPRGRGRVRPAPWPIVEEVPEWLPRLVRLSPARTVVIECPQERLRLLLLLLLLLLLVMNEEFRVVVLKFYLTQKC